MDRTITPQNLFDSLRSKTPLIIIDVRSPKEHAQWSMYNSLNIPLKNLREGARTIPKSDTVVLVCNYGNDSGQAADMLSKKGIAAQYLKGGLKAWSRLYDFVPIEEKHSSLMVYQCKRMGKGCLSYIIVLPDKKSAILIDPTADSVKH